MSEYRERWQTLVRTVSENPLGSTIVLVGFLSSIGGIMGIVEGWVRWHDFIANHFLDYYKSLVRQPISWTVGLVWPETWPKPPTWAFDVMVLWGVAANAAARFYFSAAAPHDVDMRRNMAMAAIFWPAYFLQQAWYYRLDYLEKLAIGGPNQKLTEYEEWVMYKTLVRRKWGFRRALRFVGAVVLTLVVITAFNYQLDLIQPD